MRADNSQHIIATARRRAAATHKRATTTLRRMDNSGDPISFDAVARSPSLPFLALHPARTPRRDRTPPNPPQPTSTRSTGPRPATCLRHLAPAAPGHRHRAHPSPGERKPATAPGTRPGPRRATSGHHPTQQPRHAEAKILGDHRALLMTASTTLSSLHHNWSQQ